MKEKTFKYWLYYMSMIGVAGFSWIFIGFIALIIFPQMPFDIGLGFAQLIIFGIIYIPLSLLLIGIIYIIHLSELLIKKIIMRDKYLLIGVITGVIVYNVLHIILKLLL